MTPTTSGDTGARLLGIVIQICNCIAYAHSRGVLHRDLKPGERDARGVRRGLRMDWGLAKITRADVKNPVVGGGSTRRRSAPAPAT
ncbi:MAG: hypothetical protein R3F43_22755 [bacterium]